MVIFISYNSSKTNLKYFPLTVINKKMVNAGLLIFHAVAEPRNSGKTAKFGRSLIKYMSVQHI